MIDHSGLAAGSTYFIHVRLGMCLGMAGRIKAWRWLGAGLALSTPHKSFDFGGGGGGGEEEIEGVVLSRTAGSTVLRETGEHLLLLLPHVHE